MLIREFSFHSSGITTWSAKLFHQALVRPSVVQNLLSLLSRLHLSRFTRVKVLVVVDNNLERFSLLFFVVFLYIDYCMIQLNARNYAWNKRKHDTAQHSCVRHLGKALDKRHWRWHLTSAFSQRLRKYTFTSVHTKTHKRRFQIYPLWRAFSNLCVYGERFHRLRVDGRPKRIKKFAFTSVCVYNRLRVDGA